ncbi:PadR family transcriptional regulator [Cellulomonas sp. CW35]|uniref:PadR family transcriptional regulator n=1 Tax=Cellulomonas uda TaxID=1714 RepID=A0A4Y3K9I0_CELUD|nr:MULTISPECIES: PadR family transcriptional regulator [Cellulomonas]ASR56006.1 PadR family transcriptional regulator [Cellulomonas sp. PSBB021]NII66343.1 DNA-binding PadR family transcriptional regulator [Cellulomonas uda]GEA81129.1 PadR family transcriptional regulator [Cellulomonas uda]
MRGRSDVLEPAILGLLHESPMHGYELRKRLNLVLGSFRALSYGSLYPCLKSLAERGWIVGTESPADPHAVGSKRARIVYQITADGKEHLQSVLATSGPAAWEDENFDVRFAFFAQTDAETRLRILEGRRTRLTERLETIRQSVARTRERMDEYTLELQRHGLEQAEREVRWLDGLIDNERGVRRARPAGTGHRAGATSTADGEHAAPARSTEKERG